MMMNKYLTFDKNHLNLTSYGIYCKNGLYQGQLQEFEI